MIFSITRFTKYYDTKNSPTFALLMSAVLSYLFRSFLNTCALEISLFSQTA